MLAEHVLLGDGPFMEPNAEASLLLFFLMFSTGLEQMASGPTELRRALPSPKNAPFPTVSFSVAQKPAWTFIPTRPDSCCQWEAWDPVVL